MEISVLGRLINLTVTPNFLLYTPLKHKQYTILPLAQISAYLINNVFFPVKP